MKCQKFNTLLIIIALFTRAVISDATDECGQNNRFVHDIRKIQTSNIQSLSEQIVIDYVVFYTPNSKIEAGGNEQLLNQITNAFMEANLHFANSGLKISHNLIEAVELPINNTSTNLEVIMSELAGLPIYIEKMEEHEADTAMTIVEFQLPGGYANIPLNLRQARLGGSMWFGLPNVSGSVLAHEIGHTLGGMHDYSDEQQIRDFYPTDISYGNHFIGSTTGLCYRTIMSARATCRVNGYENDPAIKVNYFSGANVLYDGTATGDPAKADNVRVFEYYAPYVASARGANQIPIPEDPEDPSNPDDPESPSEGLLTLKIKAKKNKIVFKGKCVDRNELPLENHTVKLYRIKPNLLELASISCNSNGGYKIKLNTKGKKFQTSITDLNLFSEIVKKQ